MVTVILPAAGRGKRLGLGVNKAFIALDGVPILVRTMQKFSQVPAVERIIVVVAPDEVAFTGEFLKAYSGLKDYVVVVGGAERQYSIANGLKLLPTETDIVLVHDAARPLVSLAVIENVISAAEKFGGAIAAVPEKNTIKVVGDDGNVLSTPPRQSLWAVQTPQGFRREIIQRAYQQAETDGFLGTDDASLVERLGLTVKVVMSDYENIKITTTEDMLVAKAFLSGLANTDLTELADDVITRQLRFTDEQK